MKKTLSRAKAQERFFRFVRALEGVGAEQTAARREEIREKIEEKRCA